MNVFWPDCIIFWTINIKNIAMRAIKDFISYQRNHVLTLMFTYNSFKKKDGNLQFNYTCKYNEIKYDVTKR